MAFRYQIHTATKPARGDQILRALGYNNKEAQKMIDKGRMRTLEGQAIQKSQIFQGKFQLCVFEANGEIQPFFTHKDFAIFNKPHHLLTHPKGCFEHKSLCDSIKAFLGKQAQPLHRLDYETSGALLVSKNRESEIELKKAFEEKRVKKTYLALVSGIIQEGLTIDVPILTPQKYNRGDLGIRCRIHEDGKPSQTLIQPIAYLDQSHHIAFHPNQVPFPYLYHRTLSLEKLKQIDISAMKAPAYTLLKIRPITGRTHQIRIHLAHINHPIVYESLYCDDTKARIYLDNKFKEDHKNFLRLHSLELKFCYKQVHYGISVPCHQDFLNPNTLS